MSEFKQKFHITPMSGMPLPKGGEFFVLRIDKGAADACHARVSVDYYAQGIMEDEPELSRQILDGLDRLDAGEAFYEA